MKAKLLTFCSAAILAFSIQNANAIEPGTSPQYPAGVTDGIPTGTIYPATFYLDWYTNLHVTQQVDVNGKNTGININVFVNNPQIHYAPDFTIFGAQFQAFAQLPFIDLDVTGLQRASATGVSNPYISPFNLSWTLAPGLFFSIGEGFYFAAGDAIVRNNFATFEQNAAISYLRDGWNLTAHGIYDWNQVNAVSNYTSGNVATLDLTAMKNFYGIDIGPIGYWQKQTTPDSNNGLAFGPHRPTFGEFEKFGLGGQVAHNFGPAIIRASVTSDVYARSINAGTIGWLIITVPFTEVRKPPAIPMVVAKY